MKKELKPKPRKVQQRIVRDMKVIPGQPIEYIPPVGAIYSNKIKTGNYRLTEIREGEQVISREALAAEWDRHVMDAISPGCSDGDVGFRHFCEQLGFPVSTKGEGL